MQTNESHAHAHHLAAGTRIQQDLWPMARIDHQSVWSLEPADGTIVGISLSLQRCYCVCYAVMPALHLTKAPILIMTFSTLQMSSVHTNVILCYVNTSRAAINCV